MPEITPDELAELKRLEKKATPGLWKIERGNVGTSHPLFIVAALADGWRAPRDQDTEYIATLHNLALKLIACAEEAEQALTALRKIRDWESLFPGGPHASTLKVYAAEVVKALEPSASKQPGICPTSAGSETDASRFNGDRLGKQFGMAGRGGRCPLSG